MNPTESSSATGANASSSSASASPASPAGFVPYQPVAAVSHHSGLTTQNFASTTKCPVDPDTVPLDDLAALADKILEVAGPPQAIFAISMQKSALTNTKMEEMQGQINQLKTQIQALTSQLNTQLPFRGRSRSRGNLHSADNSLEINRNRLTGPKSAGITRRFGQKHKDVHNRAHIYILTPRTQMHNNSHDCREMTQPETDGDKSPWPHFYQSPILRY
eukprot:gene1257-biopygen484